jgi:hypothetical protein
MRSNTRSVGEQNFRILVKFYFRPILNTSVCSRNFSASRDVHKLCTVNGCMSHVILIFILREECAKRGYTPAYLFLLFISRLRCSLFYEAFKSFSVKISSASLGVRTLHVSTNMFMTAIRVTIGGTTHHHMIHWHIYEGLPQKLNLRKKTAVSSAILMSPENYQCLGETYSVHISMMTRDFNV